MRLTTPYHHTRYEENGSEGRFSLRMPRRKSSIFKSPVLIRFQVTADTRGLWRKSLMHTPPCLLIVDDQPLNVDILCSSLAVHGYEILTAHTGDDALALATTRHPDLLLLDVLLPTLDGLAVCRQLKAEPSLPFLPILMLSAKTAPQDIIAGLEAGADD